MKGKYDAKLEAALGRSPRGGRALQRLFAFHGQRDPGLNDSVVLRTRLPETDRPRYYLTAGALAAGADTAPDTGQERRPSAGYAGQLSAAAAALTEEQERSAAAIIPTPISAWTFIGPVNVPNGQTYGTNRVSVVGRVACVAIDPSNHWHVLCGAADGGIWESTDEGETWLARTDKMPSLAIGAITFDPQNPLRVYAGSGEGNFYSSLGQGVYRSNDGGRNWTVLSSTTGQSSPFIGAGFFGLVVDPHDPTETLCRND